MATNTAVTEGATRKRVAKWRIFGACIVLLAAGVALMPPSYNTHEVIGYMLRVTARVAFLFLILAYVARPLQQLFGKGRLLVRNRRYLGLSMALAHTIHFGYVVAYIVVVGEPVDLITYIGGGLAFVLMWLMAATSNDASMRALGANWKRLHTVGLHYVWIIFMLTFAGRLGPADKYFIYTGLILSGFAALGLRIWAYQRFKRSA